MNTTATLSVENLDPTYASPDIAIYTNILVSGGIELIFIRLIAFLVERGVRVDLVVNSFEGALTDKIPAGVRVIELGEDWGKGYFINFIPRIGRYLEYLRLARPPIVHSSPEKASIIACIGRRFSKHSHKLIVAQVASPIDPIPVWKQWRRWPNLLSVNITYPSADSFITPSRGLAEQTRTLFLLLKHKTIVPIYNPLLHFYDAGKDTDFQFPQVVDLSKKVILSVARLDKEKDYPTLFQAFAIIRETIPSQLVILGQGKLKDMLEQMAKDMGISDDVHFLGFVSNPMSYMAHADVFVLPSKREGFGNVVLEALSTGTPVVSTDCPYGPSEILQDGRLGKLVKVGDSTEMAAAIIDVLQNGKTPISAELKAHLETFDAKTISMQYMESLGLKGN